MDESSAVTLPSPLDVLDNSIGADNSSGISISDFRAEYKDLVELGKVHSSDVGCQQDMSEDTNNISENEDGSTPIALLDPMFKKQSGFNETSITNNSRAYLYGRQLYSDNTTKDTSHIVDHPKPSNGTVAKNAFTNNIPSSHHAHYSHHHHPYKQTEYSSTKNSDYSTSVNGMKKLQQPEQQSLECNKSPVDLNNPSAIYPQRQPPMVCGTLPVVASTCSRKQICSSVDGTISNSKLQVYIIN